MHARTHLAILIAGTIGTFAGGALVACTTDDFIPIPGFDAGRPNAEGTSGGPNDGGRTNGGEGSEDSGVDCGAPKTPRANVGVYCRSGATGADSNDYCAVGTDKICCSDAKDDSGKFIKGECVVATSTGDGYDEGHCSSPPGRGGREWHCTEKAHCPPSSACCVIAGTAGDPKATADRCGDLFNKAENDAFVGGTRCKAACGSTELALCSKTEDCADGKTCKFFNLASRFTGVCQ